MSITGIIIAAVIVGGTGLFIGVFLGAAGKKFAVEVDEREEAIAGVLPGNNCGGCGYAGCSGLAAAIVKGEAEIGTCPVGGSPVAAKIGAIMGVEAGEQVREVAFVKCSGSCDVAKKEYDYDGLHDCTYVNMMQDGGPKGCNYGCLGEGSCVKVCPFDAIHIVNGVAVVDKEACKACGKCVAICPKHLIELIPYQQKCMVQCSSKEKGKDVMKVCSAGCIGCGICAKNCHFEAITLEDNLAHIDVTKCKNCTLCAQKCPKKIITPKPAAAPKKPVAKPVAEKAATPAAKPTGTESADSRGKTAAEKAVTPAAETEETKVQAAGSSDENKTE